MVLHEIFADFKKIPTIEGKIAFLKSLQLLNLSYDINYENLIKAWEKRVEKQ